jgi:hypothetical protein
MMNERMQPVDATGVRGKKKGRLTQLADETTERLEINVKIGDGVKYVISLIISVSLRLVMLKCISRVLIWLLTPESYAVRIVVRLWVASLRRRYIIASSFRPYTSDAFTIAAALRRLVCE